MEQLRSRSQGDGWSTASRRPQFWKPVLPVPIGNLGVGTWSPRTLGLRWLDSITNMFLGIWRTGDGAQLRGLGHGSGKASFVGMQPIHPAVPAPGSEEPHAWCSYPNSLNNCIFEVGFCKWSPMRQWSMHMSKGDLHSSLMPFSQIGFMLPTSAACHLTHHVGTSVRLTPMTEW